jgi:hypothetical protein
VLSSKSCACGKSDVPSEKKCSYSALIFGEQSHDRKAEQDVALDLVGSSTGAVIRRKLLVCIQRFRLRARLGVSVTSWVANSKCADSGRFGWDSIYSLQKYEWSQIVPE